MAAVTRLREDDAPRPDVPAGEALAGAVAELARAAEGAEALQRALSPLLRRGGEGAEAFQALDELTQHLHGLRDFLDALTLACPPAWRLDVEGAADGLRLHAQKLRLTGAATADAPADPPPASGELELW